MVGFNNKLTKYCPKTHLGFFVRTECGFTLVHRNSKVSKKIVASRNLYNLHTYIRTWYKPRTYRVEIGITYIHTYGLGTSQDPTYIGS